MDAKPEAWKKALEEEGMSWPQALAPKAGAELMDSYQFSGIPFILLLDREGRIAAKNLRGEEIAKAIEDELGGGASEPEKPKAAAPAAMGMMVPATPIAK